MKLKLKSNFSGKAGVAKVAVSASLLASSLFINPAYAVNWNESGDAGQLLATAQEPLGNGPLRNIYGTVTNGADVDLYRIYISSPTTFSASVTGTFDSGLALFNSGGYGIYGNDDARLGDSNAGLPAGDPRGPQAVGWYYLGVFDINSTTPTSGNGVGPENFIAPNTAAPFTSIITASGPGGASPLTGWAPPPDATGGAVNEAYRLRLSGVSVVPEPETYAMLLAGLGLVGAMARRRKVFAEL
ncbi:PEP-CTERM protein-sorting domain-containing protein [Nitrosospira sp. Nsp14]|uniref:PEPxxWA-CTERM sorting domain-containing protein n=1 Tax=Nitrosospira sp. Nsp14 TaxID=1855333 RepID=UPI0008E63BEC|nr:PEPxxWA-CTERM sorting domain-containing protein [Nitrosospira sp. Nsp14]SFH30794.1 PEP-CTERM protein-sorting domain-containing protein [Nitrosospira sp. Nsp14]